jgi:predicted histidine transporter YuiF (NhaC family)
MPNRMLIFNPVIVSLASVYLIIYALRVNVVIALTTGAIVCGLFNGTSMEAAVSVFSEGLGGGEKIALSYAILGAFASALAHSGFSSFLMSKMVRLLNVNSSKGKVQIANAGSNKKAKFIIFFTIGVMAIACKNIIPAHIAFIPILIPPLIGVFSAMQIDRRLVACIITFGVIIAYMVIPMGFGEIFLENIMLYYLHANGMDISARDLIHALLYPALGMIIGLLLAFVRYGKPRYYKNTGVKSLEKEAVFSRKDTIVSCLAIVAALVIQLLAKAIILSALVGFFFLSLGGVIRKKDSDDVVAGGFKMMALISFTMIAAAGFGHSLRMSGGIDEIVNWLSVHMLNSKVLASFSMLFVGFLISVGIGSSFSTVPIVASVYVPLGLKLGFSPAAIAIIVAVSGITGDAGSPTSDSTLGPTMGLNADGQHSLVYDTAIPTFLHLTIPVFLFGWIASVLL